MKGLLIGFFQVLCFLQVFGHGQLNAYPADRVTPSSFSILLHPAAHVDFVIENHRPDSTVGSSFSMPGEDTEMFFENTEEEAEDFSLQENVDSHCYFTGIPAGRSLDYLYGNSTKGLSFSENLSFVVFNKRYVVFQVFRI